MSITKMLESVYKQNVQHKKSDPAGAAKLDKLHRDAIMSKKGLYYDLWRVFRACSVAENMDIYDLLNVDMPLSAIRGETFYAGIPPITENELETAKKLNKLFENIPVKFNPNDIMIDNDGNYREYNRDLDIWGDIVDTQ